MSDISPSSIKVTKSLEEQLQGVTNSEQIKEIMKEAAISQKLAHRDWDESILVPNELGTAPRGFARAVTIDGTKHVVEGATEIELEKAVGVLYRAATTQQTEQPRNDLGRFVSAEDAAATADLELAFKRGDISASEYLQRSGAVADYLAKQGVPLEDLQEAVAEQQGARLNSSWQEATETFLKSSAGSDWPGGQQNLEIAGRLIQENGLVDQPSAEALAAVWAAMKENGLAVENPDTAYQRELSEARSAEDITRVNDKYFRGGSSSGLFNR
jgi:hypothetical protein